MIIIYSCFKEVNMGKKLENLKWKPFWVSHLGCIKGCLDYLNMDVSDAWLFGATGHSFIMNMHDVVCASGPTAWHTEMLFKLGKNIGYEIDGIVVWRSESSFTEKKKEAWDMVRKALDEGIPCYGWELSIPEFYVVNGYDDTGYYFSGPLSEKAKMPKPWQELADGDIGLIEVYSVRPIKSTDNARVVKEALEFALEYAKNPEKWIYPKYRAGLDGYDNWIRALETNIAEGFGTAYNSAVWHECRHYAVEFLKEAKGRINKQELNPLFDEAIQHYKVVADNLKKVEDLFPFHELKPEHIQEEDRRAKAIEALKTARDAEAQGLESLAGIVNAL
jgi:hypothetical protein